MFKQYQKHYTAWIKIYASLSQQTRSIHWNIATDLCGRTLLMLLKQEQLQWKACMYQKCHLFRLPRNALRLSQKTPFCEKCSYADALRNVRLMRLFSNKNKRATYHRNWHDHRHNDYHPIWKALLAAVRVFDTIVITEKSAAIGRNDQTQKSVYEPDDQ